MQPFDSAAVESVYAGFSDSHRACALKLREIVLETAASLDLPGGVQETLKWREPSYLPVKPRIGSTVRLGAFDQDSVALYFNCQTTLVERFRTMFADQLAYSGNRAVLFDTSEPLPEETVRECVRMALRYHLDKPK